MSSTAAALAPLVLLIVGFEIWCVRSIVTHEPKVLPRWAWILVCLASVPLGGIVYLLVGRSVDGAPSSPSPSTTEGVPSNPGTGAVEARPPAAPRPAPATRPSGRPALATTNLRKQYGSRVVLDDVDLVVEHGSILGLVGPNGAGKTTLLSLVAGLRQPDAGGVQFGVDPARVAYLPDTPTFEPWLTAREVVDLARSLVLDRHGDGSSGAERTSAALARTGLTDAADRRVGGFSRGMLQRLGLAATIVGEPELLLLDEPCSALDPAGRREVLDLVGSLGSDHTVVFCSHILDDVQEVCDTVAILRAGHLLYDGPIEELFVGEAAAAVSVRVRPPLGPVVDALQGQAWVRGVEQVGAEQLLVTVTTLTDAEREIARVLADAHAAVVSISPAGMDLERVFLELTR